MDTGNKTYYVTSPAMARCQHLDPRVFERRCEKIGIEPDAFIVDATGPKALFDGRNAGAIRKRLAEAFHDHVAKAFDETDPFEAYHGQAEN